MANLLQVAMINKMLPKGFRFELLDTVRRQTDATTTKNVIPKKRKVRMDD